MSRVDALPPRKSTFEFAFVLEYFEFALVLEYFALLREEALERVELALGSRLLTIEKPFVKMEPERLLSSASLEDVIEEEAVEGEDEGEGLSPGMLRVFGRVLTSL